MGFAAPSGKLSTILVMRLRCVSPFTALRTGFFALGAETQWNRTRYTFVPLPCFAIFNKSTRPLNPDSRASSAVTSDISICSIESISMCPTPVLS